MQREERRPVPIAGSVTTVDVALDPATASNHASVMDVVRQAAGVPHDCPVVVRKRSIDARSRNVVVRIRADVFTGQEPPAVTPIMEGLPPANPKKRVVVIGSGPAGMFAALELLEHGITPIVLERGKDVRARRRDLRAIQQFGIVDPHSNYCFGEGGAGTYSDGKLYTRSHKRGNIEKVLRLLVEHGATPDILIDAHPHIGSNKLWLVVQAMRQRVLSLGGEVHFETWVTDFITTNDEPRRVLGVVANNREWLADAVVVATGHSARDVYQLCVRRGIYIEAKPFALGVRVEHPQEFIDSVQYHSKARDPHLPAASYSLVCQSGGRGVFSFCMCPGGIIVPAATQAGELVVNGMSMSRRDSRFANSGTVVAIEPEDWQQYAGHGALAAMAYQAHVERKAFDAVPGTTQRAPAQRLTDFVARKESATLPDSSYIPGLASANLWAVLPNPVAQRLSDAIRLWASSMRGYLTSDAVMVATESRTSSPVRLPRHRTTMEHVGVLGLYPCGEGAGYAGGIVSAALDGQNVAQAIVAARFHGKP
jgi:uncharacterized FAD-dependent dehydrogenase